MLRSLTARRTQGLTLPTTTTTTTTLLLLSLLPPVNVGLGMSSLLHARSRTQAESRFVFMPGPDDAGPAGVLPQPPLPRALTTELRRVLPTAQFASNPCRLRYATQRIVLFRHDLQRRLLRRTLLPLAGE